MAKLVFSKVTGLEPEHLPENEFLCRYFSRISLSYFLFPFLFSFLRTPASRGTLGLLLPILEVIGFFKFICDDAGNFLNPKYLPGTYFVTSLEVKPSNSGI